MTVNCDDDDDENYKDDEDDENDKDDEDDENDDDDDADDDDVTTSKQEKLRGRQSIMA